MNDDDAKKWIRQGFNVAYCDFRENLDPAAQVEAVVCCHAENLRRQAGQAPAVASGRKRARLRSL
ncbi:MAG: hypothetical protein ACKVPX_06380 [Myxococcaceae bacterium]